MVVRKGFKLATEIGCFSNGEIPVDWEENVMLNHHNDYSLKLTDQVMKLLDWDLDFHIPKMVNTSEMEFCFVPGKGRIDAIFVVCQLHEKYIALTNRSILPLLTNPWI